MIVLLLSVFTLSIVSCGYKPSSKYAREILGNKISTSVSISQTDPENSVIIKDAVDKAIIEIFHASLVDKRYATTHLNLSMTTPSYAPLQYDNDGFIISYRATITLLITRESKNLKKNYKTVGTYDFSVVPNSVLTDQERFDAIKFSSFKAISAFIAQVSAEGSKVK
ncbi:hypothetical protein JHD49_01710 [Sulfurimonas sp. SAG-AH-194-C21]|nr:hypothetical protein [Sulfurimonas sp. SAG-AH-194-C21]